MIMPYRISSKKKMSLCFILSGYRYVSILDLIDFKTKGLEVVTISKLALYKRKESFKLSKLKTFEVFFLKH